MITGGEHRAHLALVEQNQAMAEGQQVSHVEQAQLMIALNQVLGQMGMFAEQQQILIANAHTMDKEIQGFRNEMAAMRMAQQLAASNVDPTEKKKAEVTLADAVQKSAVNHQARMNNTRTILQGEQKENIEWYGQPYQLQINGVRFNIKQGINTVPSSVAQHVKNRIRLEEQQAARVALLQIGSRRDGRRMLKREEVDYGLRMIDHHYGSAPKLDERQAANLIRSATENV